MDRKRELSSVDLRALVTELGRYEGAKVDKAYLYGDDLVRLKLRDFDRGRVELLVEVGEVKRAHVAAREHVPDAPGRPPNFAKMLRNRLSGADLVDVEQYEFDRILTFEFDRPDGRTKLVAELFGQGNVAVLDGTGEVVDSLETVRLKSRTVAPGSQYEFPSSRVNPLRLGYDAFARQMEDSDTDVVRTLATQLNWGGLYAEELCTRAGVEKTLAIAEADDAVYEALFDEVTALKDRLRSGAFEPRVYLEDDAVVDVTPFPLAEYEGRDAEHYDSFNEALDEYFFRLDLEAEAGRDEPDRPDFEAEVAKYQRIVEQQEGAIEGFEEEARRVRERAELLYANYDLVDDILTTIRDARAEGVPWDEIESTLAAGAEQGIPAAAAVQSVDGKERTVTVAVEDETVTLDVTVGVEKNANRLYNEAKRVEGKKEGALDAIEDTREQLEAVRERREAWASRDGDAPESADDEDGDEREVDWLVRSSIPLRQPDHWYERFRWFHTSDGFLVLGGRNADQNEALVKKYLGKHDRFFHTQAHGGPVTVLKATGPSEPARAVDFPESSLREAAQFAVSYSTIWKEGRYADDAYEVSADQVSKTPESGEYLEKGSFVVRGDRTYYRDVTARVGVGIACDPETRVLGGPPSAIRDQVATMVELEPGRYAQNDAAKLVYREFRERFADQSFVRKVASPDRIQEFLPPGGSDLLEE